MHGVNKGGVVHRINPGSESSEEVTDKDIIRESLEISGGKL